MMGEGNSPESLPPEASPRTHRLARMLARSVEKFLHVEASSGIILPGIGFTMALFIGALAFSDPSMLAIAKIAVLVASAIAGVLGLTLGYLFLPCVQPSTNGATTPHAAETSTTY